MSLSTSDFVYMRHFRAENEIKFAVHVRDDDDSDKESDREPEHSHDT